MTGFAFGVGSGSYDAGQSIEVDASGNLIVAGIFQGSMDFDPGPGGSVQSSGGGNDGYLAKYDSAGNLDWNTQFYSSSNIGLGVDSLSTAPNGDIVVMGGFSGSATIGSGLITQNISATGPNSVFLSKFDSAGDLQWVQTNSGSAESYATGTAVDSDGNIYVTGIYSGSMSLGSGAGTVALTAQGSYDVFVAKYDSAGNLAWAADIGSTASDLSHSLDISGGEVVVTGSFQGAIDFDPGAGSETASPSGGTNSYVLKLNAADGTYASSTTINSSSNTPSEVTIDASGNSIVTGYFNGTVDTDPGATGGDISSNGSWDAYLAKYDPSNNLLWSKAIGGSSGDFGNAVRTDNTGNIYVSGVFEGTAEFDGEGGSFQLTSGGGRDGFIAKYDPDGNFVWAKSYGAAGSDAVQALSVGPNGELAAIGSHDAGFNADYGDGSVFISDKGGIDSFVVRFAGDPAPTATSGDDTIYGTSEDDTIDGLAGNDQILGLEGSDLLSGAAGDDTIEGGAGNDTIEGGDGADGLLGGDGDDTIIGNSGNDTLRGFNGADVVSGGDGIDVIAGELGADTLHGGANTDVFVGTESQHVGDTILDFSSEDILQVTGVDLSALDGQVAGDLQLSAGTIFLNGVLGIFSVTWDGVNSQVRLNDLASNSIVGTSSDDSIVGTGADEIIYALAGDDIIKGKGGNDEMFGDDGGDTLRGNQGNDVLQGGLGDDNLHGGQGNDTLSGGDGADSLHGGKGSDLLDGGFGDDTLRAGWGQDTLLGGAGNDELRGGSDADVIAGDAGNDSIRGGDSNDMLSGDAGDDTVRGNFGNDVVFGQNGNDDLHGGQGDDVVFGGIGSDTIGGGKGDDTLLGEDGNDLIYGRRDNDSVEGGLGDDTLRGNQGNDTLNGGAGSDDLHGGKDDDTFIFNLAENAGGSDYLHGGSGSDHLQLELSVAEQADAAIQSDLTALQAWIDGGSKKEFSFSSFDLTIKNIESYSVVDPLI